MENSVWIPKAVISRRQHDDTDALSYKIKLHSAIKPKQVSVDVGAGKLRTAMINGWMISMGLETSQPRI